MLFKEFEPVSSRQWKLKIQADLKGADYNETLIWKSPEGIDVKPFYHREDFKEPFAPIPGQPSAWKAVQHVFIDDESIANKLAVNAIRRGAEGIRFTAEKEFDPTLLFNGIDLDEVSLYISPGFLDAAFLKKLITDVSLKNSQSCFGIDPIGNLAGTGNWFHNLRTDHDILDELVTNHPALAVLSVDGSLYQNAGATIVQQLAYSLAHANEYLNHLYQNGQKDLKLTFNLAIGGNYFFEIAKIRALRKLYAALALEYGYDHRCEILAMPSRRNKTLYDYNLNMLRTTTECMSAAIGGANAICNLPYDALYHKSNEFGERISRNQLLVMKAETYLDTVSNPADGTYYVEALTDQLAEKALRLFKELEQSGGFLKMLKEGIIQKKIKESAAKEQQQFDKMETVLVGTNKFQNDSDRMKEELQLFPFVKTKSRKTLLEPVIERRLAESIEQERLANEK